MRAGSHKTEIIENIVNSEEGRKFGMKIIGMRYKRIVQHFENIPFFGQFVATVLILCDARSLAKRLRRVESQVEIEISKNTNHTASVFEQQVSAMLNTTSSTNNFIRETQRRLIDVENTTKYLADFEKQVPAFIEALSSTNIFSRETQRLLLFIENANRNLILFEKQAPAFLDSISTISVFVHETQRRLIDIENAIKIATVNTPQIPTPRNSTFVKNDSSHEKIALAVAAANREEESEIALNIEKISLRINSQINQLKKGIVFRLERQNEMQSILGITKNSIDLSFFSNHNDAINLSDVETQLNHMLLCQKSKFEENVKFENDSAPLTLLSDASQVLSTRLQGINLVSQRNISSKTKKNKNRKKY